MFANREPNNYINNGYSGQMMHQIPLDVRWKQQNERNQSYPYPAPAQNFDWNSYQQQGPYYPQQFQAYGQNPQPGYMQPNMAYPNKSYPTKDSQFLFQNPLQPQTDSGKTTYMPMNGYPMMNPYPKQQSIIPKQAGGMQSFMNSFKGQDGSVDFNKMMNTAGQMMNAVNQVTSLVKGFGGIFKI
jgi:hypothetical protein